MLDTSTLNIILTITVIILAFASVFKRSIVINNNLKYHYSEDLGEVAEQEE